MNRKENPQTSKPEVEFGRFGSLKGLAPKPMNRQDELREYMLRVRLKYPLAGPDVMNKKLGPDSIRPV